MNEKNVLIVYASKYGCTSDAARQLAHIAKWPVMLFDSKNGRLMDESAGVACESIQLSDYGLVIIGSPLYMGKPFSNVVQFCKRYEAELLLHNLAFFTCGVGTAKEDRDYLRAGIPPSFTQKNAIYGHFGGEVRLEKMSVFERFAMKEYAKKHGPAQGIDLTAIRNFINKVNMH